MPSRCKTRLPSRSFRRSASSSCQKEAGWLLITAGVVGLVVPGVLGTPFLLAGAVVLVPGGSKLLSRWAGRSAMRQIGRFLDDLGRRYPRR
jgi:hypothetical protein